MCKAWAPTLVEKWEAARENLTPIEKILKKLYCLAKKWGHPYHCRPCKGRLKVFLLTMAEITGVDVGAKASKSAFTSEKLGYR